MKHFPCESLNKNCDIDFKDQFQNVKFIPWWNCWNTKFEYFKTFCFLIKYEM